MDPRLPWFALSHVPGLGAVSMRRLVARFGSPEAVLAASRSDLVGVGRLTPHQAGAVRRLAENPKSLVKEMQRLAGEGVRVVLMGEPSYPEALACMHDAPAMLQIRGEMPQSDTAAVAVVGTRAASGDATSLAMRASEALAGVGVCVVSGMALGIDEHAHYGALNAGGRTVAVLGSGVLRPYPSQHGFLAEKITLQGAVISEVPATWPPSRGTLMARNRIIAGLARAVLIVQTRGGGGAIATARRALHLRRPAFAIEWQEEPYVLGCRMLRQIGARIVPSLDVFLEEKPWAG